MGLFDKFLAMLTATDKVKLEKAMLPEMDIEIDADKYEVGEVAHVLTPEGERFPLPEGSYELDGLEGVKGIVVDENGVITQVMTGEAEAEVETEVEAETEVEVEAESEVEKENVEESVEEVKTEPNLSDSIETIKKELMAEIMAACDEKYEAKKTAMVAHLFKVKKPINPNPEGNAPKVEEFTAQTPPRAKTPMDRVLEQLNK